jgi:TfoX/Sxy family transcriptional regulator of competence genes
MAGIPDDLPKLVQIKIRRKICDQLIEHLEQFDPESFFDGEEEKALALAYYQEEVLSEIVSTIGTCR